MKTLWIRHLNAYQTLRTYNLENEVTKIVGKCTNIIRSRNRLSRTHVFSCFFSKTYKYSLSEFLPSFCKSKIDLVSADSDFYFPVSVQFTWAWMHKCSNFTYCPQSILSACVQDVCWQNKENLWQGSLTHVCVQKNLLLQQHQKKILVLRINLWDLVCCAQKSKLRVQYNLQVHSVTKVVKSEKHRLNWRFQWLFQFCHIFV